MSRICGIFNIAPVYRTAIYCAIDREFDCSWVFGRTNSDIRQMDTSLLNDVRFVNNRTFLKRPLYYQVGVVKQALFGKQEVVLMTSEATAVSTYVVLLLKPLLAPRKRIYVWTHGLYGKESRVRRIIEKIKYLLVDGIFTYGNYARNLMIEQGYKAERIFVIHNSLDYNAQIKIRCRLSGSDKYASYFGNDNPVLLFIGRLTKVKKLDMLFRAVYNLKTCGKWFNIVIIGDGETRSELEKIVEELNLKKQVWFYGPCYDDYQNAQLIYDANLCVAPGNVGLTAMHTMTFGTPVLTHNNFKMQMPEFEAIIPGVTGDFFDYGSVDSLSKGILKWTESHPDRDAVRKACYKEIDDNWTPEFQMDILRKNLK